MGKTIYSSYWRKKRKYLIYKLYCVYVHLKHTISGNTQNLMPKSIGKLYCKELNEGFKTWIVNGSIFNWIKILQSNKWVLLLFLKLNFDPKEWQITKMCSII